MPRNYQTKQHLRQKTVNLVLNPLKRRMPLCPALTQCCLVSRTSPPLYIYNYIRDTNYKAGVRFLEHDGVRELMNESGLIRGRF